VPSSVADDVGIVSSLLEVHASTWGLGCEALNCGLTVDIHERRLETMSDLSEQVALARLEERLTGIYAGLPADRVSAAVQDAHARFDQSPIRDFVPLLVERRVRAQLAAASN
jgi:hypothetical protein